jgi:hypothetical protein
VTLALGTKRRWKFLVDPPEEWNIFYSALFIKKYFGTNILIVFNYICAFSFILLSVLFFVFLLAGRVKY